MTAVVGVVVIVATAVFVGLLAGEVYRSFKHRHLFAALGQVPLVAHSVLCPTDSAHAALLRAPPPDLCCAQCSLVRVEDAQAAQECPCVRACMVSRPHDRLSRRCTRLRVASVPDGERACGCVGVWVCGCVGVWVCGCVGVWVCGCVGVWVCGCVGVWVCGCVGVLVVCAGVAQGGQAHCAACIAA
jgi:hypothetical protein